MKKWTVLATILLLVVAGCGGNDRKKPSNGKKSGTEAVALTRVSIGRVADTLEEAGELKPRSVVKVKFQLTGKIAKIYKEEGDSVREGERVALLYPDVNQRKQYSTADIGYRKALADAEQLSNDLAEGETLYAQGLIPRSRRDQLAQNYEIAVAEADKARMEIVSLSESGKIVEGQGVNVTSPSAGTIVKRWVDVGDFVIAASAYQSGSVLFEVADIGDLVVEAQINEMDILHVRQDAIVDFTIEAMPGKKFKGKVFRVLPTPVLKDNVKRYVVQVAPAERVPAEIRSGMSCRIQVTTAEKSNIPVLPLSAVVRDDKRKIDYCLIPVSAGDFKYDRVTVKTGIRNSDQIEIVDGLSSNAQVVKNPYTVPETLVKPETNTKTGNDGTNAGKRPPNMRSTRTR